METKEIGFSDKLKSAVLIVEEVKALLITTPQEYALAGSKEDEIRGLEKDLEVEYKTHPIIIQARNLQTMKSDLAKLLEDSRKSIKGKRIAYDEIQERKRRDEERRLQEAAQKLADEEKLKEALAAEKSGDKKAAQSIIEQEITVPTIILPKDTQKAGAPTRTIWAFQIDNPNLIPREYCVPDQAALNARAKADKEATDIPGGRAFSRKV